MSSPSPQLPIKTTQSAPVAHPPVPKPQTTPAPEADSATTMVQRAVNAAGGSSPQTPPTHYGSLLGQLQGRPNQQKGVLKQLQRSYGNQYVGRVIQAKLTVGQSGDKYEEEADRVADAVMRMPEDDIGSGVSVAGHIQPLRIQRMCEDYREEEERIHPKEVPGHKPTVTPALEFRLSAASGSGHPLPGSVRSFMEPRFGADFSGVRVHTGEEAEQLNRELGAQAFTHGQDVYFGAGKYSLESGLGKRLLAHELAHVVQQNDRHSVVDMSSSLTIREKATTAIQMKSQLQTVSPTQRSSATGILVPDSGPLPKAHQMTETQFKKRARETLNQAGWLEVKTLIPGNVSTRELGLGDVYIAGLENISSSANKSIEELVGETLQASYPTAEKTLTALRQMVSVTFQERFGDIQQMMESPPVPESTAEGGVHHDPDPRDAGVRLPAGVPEAAPKSETELRNLYPEISSPLAAKLAPISGSIWGPLRVLLQGLIFHSIISAGYLFGYPAPAHPLALINKGGGALGRKRTDLRDPTTSAVIEIKPLGDGGGTAQLQKYINTLGLPWHQALDIPTEAWPPSGTRANYQLSHFGIQLTLQAWNNFGVEPGMLYYELVVTPGSPVYVPTHDPQTNRRFQFRLPRVSLPRLPQPSQEVIMASSASAVAIAIVVVAAVLIPGVPPPP